MSEPEFRVVFPHDIKSLCVADIPWVVAWARMPYSSQIFNKVDFEALRQGYHDKIEQAFINEDFEGMSISAESKESVFEQMLDSTKSLDEWGGYFSRRGIEVIIAEPSSSSGRYNLYNASKMIAQKTNELERAANDFLAQAVLDGSLPVYPPGSQLRYYPREINNFYEEAYWDDLNNCLETFARELSCRFIRPIKGTIESVHTQSGSTPFSNPPLRKDEWWDLCLAMMLKYKKEHGEYPNFSQAWAALWDSPPKGYDITTGTDRGGEIALHMGGKSLSQSACKQRFKRWSK